MSHCDSMLIEHRESFPQAKSYPMGLLWPFSEPDQSVSYGISVLIGIPVIRKIAYSYWALRASADSCVSGLICWTVLSDIATGMSGI